MKKLAYILVFIFYTGHLVAQEVQTSSYYFNPLRYNPAYTGTRETLSMSISQQNQWNGIKGAPQTTFLSVHSPIGNSQLSVGADLMYDKIGVSKTTSAFVDIAYYIQLNEKGSRLSFGLKGGVNLFDIALSDLYADRDILKKDISNEMRGNFGAGIYYYSPKYFVGISAMSLLKSSVLDSEADIKLVPMMPHYYLTAGYIYDISENITLRPTALVKVTEGEKTILDAELALILYEKVYIGMGYQYENAMRGYAMLRLTPQLTAGYNYDYMFNDLKKYTGGVHIFMLRYDLNWKKQKKFF